MKRGSDYERELKNILTGDRKLFEKICKTCTPKERSNYYLILDKPFLVMRAGGSLGIDLVAIRGDVSFPIEVKSSVNERVMFSQSSGTQQLQAETFLRECERTGVVLIYAFRRKGVHGDSWRVYTLPEKNLEGIPRLINNLLPKIHVTSQGNFVLRWSDGMPLNRFIEFLNTTL